MSLDDIQKVLPLGFFRVLKVLGCGVLSAERVLCDLREPKHGGFRSS